MADLSNRTLAELTAMTKAQLIAAALEGQTDTELEVNESAAGLGPIRRVEVVRSRLTGKVLRRKRLDWTYYPTTEVDTIVVSERDAGDVETRRYQIRHFRDERLPVVEEE